ncbi:hypothetical protein WJ968_16620 [Achromobacter xylosoxidans]
MLAGLSTVILKVSAALPVLVSVCVKYTVDPGEACLVLSLARLNAALGSTRVSTALDCDTRSTPWPSVYDAAAWLLMIVPAVGLPPGPCPRSKTRPPALARRRRASAWRSSWVELS